MSDFDFGAIDTKETETELERAIRVCAQLDNAFANDLARKARRYGPSAKQEYWILKLAREASAPPAPTRYFASIVGFLTAAQKRRPNGRLPKVAFRLADGSKVVLKLTGPRSKNPGSVNVTNGAAYGDPGNVWYGAVKSDGEWREGRACTDEVTALLDGFDADPMGFADSEGRRTGFCCFCGRELTDDREGGSVERGYGPVCAARYGLPHGSA